MSHSFCGSQVSGSGGAERLCVRVFEEFQSSYCGFQGGSLPASSVGRSPQFFIGFLSVLTAGMDGFPRAGGPPQ